MARSSSIKKNIKRKELAKRFKDRRVKLSSIAKDKSLSFDERLAAQIKLSELPRNSADVRYRNRCSLTGRPRGVYRKFSLSRISLRELASWGHIPGLIKSSW
jgi:small subunit ribosomal protein S14